MTQSRYFYIYSTEEETDTQMSHILPVLKRQATRVIRSPILRSGRAIQLQPGSNFVSQPNPYLHCLLLTLTNFQSKVPSSHVYKAVKKNCFMYFYIDPTLLSTAKGAFQSNMPIQAIFNQERVQKISFVWEAAYSLQRQIKHVDNFIQQIFCEHLLCVRYSCGLKIQKGHLENRYKVPRGSRWQRFSGIRKGFPGEEAFGLE